MSLADFTNPNPNPNGDSGVLTEEKLLRAFDAFRKQGYRPCQHITTPKMKARGWGWCVECGWSFGEWPVSGGDEGNTP